MLAKLYYTTLLTDPSLSLSSHYYQNPLHPTIHLVGFLLILFAANNLEPIDQFKMFKIERS